MIAFFVILVLLMVLVFAAGQWNGGPRRRVIYDRDVVVDRRPTVVERGPDLVEEEIVEEPYPARSRRVVRRRTY
jgi:hypothetical protein